MPVCATKEKYVKCKAKYNVGILYSAHELISTYMSYEGIFIQLY